MVNLNINWSSLTYVTGQAIKATIQVLDSSGLPPTDLAWVLYRNNVQIASGTSRDVSFQTSSGGVYRIKATAGGSTAESAVSVGGGFEIQASPLPPEVEPSCVYLGALYCDELTGSGGETDTVPYQLASFTQQIFLLPGTTHITFDLDPQQNQVDDEVIVRTPTGNFTLRGFPSGLLDEQIGYDYTGGQPMLVAPVDGILRLTIEAFNVHGGFANDFNFRVRVKCWRLGPAIYQYVRCPFTTYPGGRGKRDRQFAALFTEMEVQADVDSHMNRFGTQEAKTYKTPEVTTMPLTALATDGRPNPVQAPTGMFFTDSNWYAIYEPDDDDLPELNAKAISAQDGGLRPFYVTLEEPSDPPIIQRIKRLSGKLVVYMSQGAVTKGSVINVRVQTSKVQSSGHAEVTYQIPVDADVYNNNTDIFQKIAAINIDLEDFQFSDNGVVVFFSVDESNANPESLPCDDPIPAVPDQYLYTDLLAPAVIFDGACYTNPVVQPTVAAEGHPSGGLTGCHEPVCGPVGLYCYTDVATGTRSADFPQPLYNPAPFVAYGSNPLDCYHEPVFLHEVTSGTTYQQITTYQTDAICGDAWVYEQCGGQTRIVTVFPHNTVPHDVISYGSYCWSRTGVAPLNGSQAVLVIGTFHWDVISAGSVTPVATCLSDECSGTVVGGQSVVYIDTQTDQRLPVRFDGLDMGVPWTAVSLQVADSGIGGRPKGEKRVAFTTPRVYLFTAGASGDVDFNVGLPDFSKRIVVIRGGQTLKFEIRLGMVERIVTLQAGDQVFVDIGNAVGLLSDRTRGKRTKVVWRPIIPLPRVYHRATLSTTGTNQILALGFTGQSNRSDYSLFRTLPADVEQEFPNPDNIVTVVSGTNEYALVRTRAIGDPVSRLPGNAAWYNGEFMAGSLEFKFWTSREEQGAHGEMDVWLTEKGNVPAFFKVDPYRTLALQGGPLDVLFLMNFTSDSIRDSFRGSLTFLDQSLKAAGISPKYGIVLLDTTPLGSLGDEFYDYDALTATSYWSTANFGWNFGSPVAGMTAIAMSGTLMDWTPGAARAYVVVTPNAVYDYPPGYLEPTSTDRYDEALASLNLNSVPFFTIVNPNAPVPINPFTFVLPSNVPQSYMALAEETGGKNYTTDELVSNGTTVMQSLAEAMRVESFIVQTGTNLNDISRNALRKVFNGTEHVWPNEYVAEDGERIVVTSATGTILYDDKVYVKLGPDSGISSRIINANDVVSYETEWFTTEHDLWKTTDGETWSLE